MPLYDFQCESCDVVQEHYAGIEQRTHRCYCGATQNRIITSRYYINPDVELVTDNIDGNMTRITSRRQLRSMCKEHGVDEKYGKGWT